MKTEKTDFGWIQWLSKEEWQQKEASQKGIEQQGGEKIVQIISGTEERIAILRKIAARHSADNRD